MTGVALVTDTTDPPELVGSPVPAWDATRDRLVFDRAAFLSELRGTGAAGGSGAAGRSGVATEEVEAAAQQTIEDWCEGAALSSAQFEALLEADGLSRAALVEVLVGRELGVAVAAEPAWQHTLHAVLGRLADGSAAVSLALHTGTTNPPFAEVLDSFVAVAWDDLQARAGRPTAPALDWPALAPGLQAHLRTLLLQLCQRTLVLELNVARLEGWLDGDTPAARYACYTAALRRDPALWVKLFAEYQVLARQLCSTMERWVANLVELLGQLASDYPRLTGAAALLPRGRELRLIALAGGLSDPHRGGRGVWKLSFAAGDGPGHHALIYKPRSLAVDVHFQELVEWCNQAARRGALSLAGLRHAVLDGPAPGFPELRTLRLLDAGDHGWVEYVERRDCDDAGGAARFYLRQGAYLALLHVLAGADVHYENVIASGEHPMLVDLETLFHPWLQVSPDPAPETARTRAQVALRESVMRTALLPGLAWGDRERAGINIGGLGDGRTQLSPRASLAWAEVRTDAMHAEDRRHSVLPGDNLPRVGGEVVPAARHVEPLVAGFEAMLQLAITERGALIGPGGVLRAFADDAMRRLLRPTSAYGHLLEVGSHPDHLRDALDRDRLFDPLWKVSQGAPALLRVVATERADLRHGDVPYFGGRPSSCDLWDSRGHRLAGMLAAPPLAVVEAQLAALGHREIADQVFVLRAALSALAISSASPPATVPAPLSGVRTPLAAAIALGDRLAATAILGERDAGWLGMEASRDGAAVQLAALHGGLYDGTGGVALFLGYLGRVAGEPRFTALAARAAHATRAALADAGGDPSGFTGALSQLYVLCHLAGLWDDRTLVPPLGPILDRVATQIASDARYDVIHGAAGAILAALAIHELTDDPGALAVAGAAGRAIMAGAQRSAPRASWPCAVSARHLLGFSHGAAGVGAALHRLARAASMHRVPGIEPTALVELAEAAFDYERSQFDVVAGNWPDLRESAGGTAAAPRFMLGYCHGAPGIALSRLSGPIGPGTPARREIELAIATTLAGRVQPGQTLCHGELGNLMIVQRAAGRLGRADWQAEVARRLDVTLARLFERGPDCGFDFPPAAPALMDGTAGIGFGLLSLSRPDELPFVLDLSPVGA